MAVEATAKVRPSEPDSRTAGGYCRSSVVPSVAGIRRRHDARERKSGVVQQGHAVHGERFTRPYRDMVGSGW